MIRNRRQLTLQAKPDSTKLLKVNVVPVVLIHERVNNLVDLLQLRAPPCHSTKLNAARLMMLLNMESDKEAHHISKHQKTVGSNSD